MILDFDNRWHSWLLVITAFMFFVGIYPCTLVSAQIEFQIPESRLKSLNPQELSGYRDLAEEISLVRESKLARDLTVRLYLITAANSTGKLRRSALRGMIFSARNENERKRFKVLSYVTDPEFSTVLNSQLRATETTENKTNSKTGNTPRDRVLDALMSIRQGKSLRAKRIMEDSKVQEYFKRFESDLSLKDFNEACLMSELPNSILLKVLTIDLKIRGGEKSSKTQSNTNALEQWRKLFKEKLPNRIPEISFATVTEFDPSKSIYQNGVWQKPPK